MPKEFETQRISQTRIQSGVPARKRETMTARGLNVRGVVVATYVVDDPEHPQAENQPVAVYCDVLAYSTIPGMQQRLIKFALVKQERSGLHSGRVWKPRAATLDVNKNPMNLEKGTNPGGVDGDHVLVGFMDDAFNLPVILGGIPHPSADVGNEQKDAGHRLRIIQTDGDPDFWKHHGAFYGVTDDGDFVVDTTDAYAGNSLEDDGSEPVPVEDGTTGNYKVNLPKGSTLTVQIEDGANLSLENKDGGAKLTLGDGVRGVMIADNWETFWDGSFKSWVLAHTHGSGVGPTGIPLNSGAYPAFSASGSKSTKALIPDG